MYAFKFNILSLVLFFGFVHTGKTKRASFDLTKLFIFLLGPIKSKCQSKAYFFNQEKKSLLKVWEIPSKDRKITCNLHDSHNKNLTSLHQPRHEKPMAPSACQNYYPLQ